MPRRYVLKRRAERQADTRRRIVEAAVELHRSVGPSATSFSAVAKRAGVQRHTLYSHFPHQQALLKACREHFLALNPPPDPKRWRSEPNLTARLRLGLHELYKYYEVNREMIWSTLRDSERLPVGIGFVRLHGEAAHVLVEGWPWSPEKARAAAWLATDFFAWRSLRDAGLDSHQAVAAVVALISAGDAD